MSGHVGPHVVLMEDFSQVLKDLLQAGAMFGFSAGL